MSSINGISIKNVKSFRGHEFEHVNQGDVYKNGKKVGWWSQDSWGGEDEFENCYADVLNAAKMFQAGFPAKKDSEGRNTIQYECLAEPGCFMETLIMFRDYERMYKKLAKSFPGVGAILFVTSRTTYSAWHIAAAVKSFEELKDKDFKAYAGILKQFGKEPFAVWCCESLKDLDIIVDDKHPASPFLEGVMFAPLH